MLSSETLLEQAEEIFFELANENLSEAKMKLLQENPNCFYLELNDGFCSSWDELIYDEVGSESYIQIECYVQISTAKTQLALILLALDFEQEKDCHIQW